MNPIFPSPLLDGGYDVSDYRGVHPDLGTLDDLRALVAAARERGIRVLLDMVPNHTSDRHPWFAASRSRDSPYRRYYTWVTGDGPPNNWRSRFGGPAWTRDERTGDWYEHSFLPEQPDLNWRHEPVRREFGAISEYWWDLGVAGFRLDVIYGLTRDPQLRDNPPAQAGDPPEWLRLGQRLTGNLNQPDVHPILAAWRRRADAHGAVLLGEAAETLPELHLTLGSRSGTPASTRTSCAT